MSLIVDLKVGETLTIGTATVRMEKKSGQQARLVITAGEDTKIIPPNQRHTNAKETRMSAFQQPGAHHG